MRGTIVSTHGAPRTPSKARAKTYLPSSVAPPSIAQVRQTHVPRRTFNRPSLDGSGSTVRRTCKEPSCPRSSLGSRVDAHAPLFFYDAQDALFSSIEQEIRRLYERPEFDTSTNSASSVRDGDTRPRVPRRPASALATTARDVASFPQAGYLPRYIVSAAAALPSVRNIIGFPEYYQHDQQHQVGEAPHRQLQRPGIATASIMMDPAIARPPTTPGGSVRRRWRRVQRSVMSQQQFQKDDAEAPLRATVALCADVHKKKRCCASSNEEIFIERPRHIYDWHSQDSVEKGSQDDEAFFDTDRHLIDEFIRGEMIRRQSERSDVGDLRYCSVYRRGNSEASLNSKKEGSGMSFKHDCTTTTTTSSTSSSSNSSSSGERRDEDRQNQRGTSKPTAAAHAHSASQESPKGESHASKVAGVTPREEIERYAELPLAELLALLRERTPGFPQYNATHLQNFRSSQPPTTSTAINSVSTNTNRDTKNGNEPREQARWQGNGHGPRCGVCNIDLTVHSELPGHLVEAPTVRAAASQAPHYQRDKNDHSLQPLHHHHHLQLPAQQLDSFQLRGEKEDQGPSLLRNMDISPLPFNVGELNMLLIAEVAHRLRASSDRHASKLLKDIYLGHLIASSSSPSTLPVLSDRDMDVAHLLTSRSIDSGRRKEHEVTAVPALHTCAECDAVKETATTTSSSSYAHRSGRTYKVDAAVQATLPSLSLSTHDADTHKGQMKPLKDMYFTTRARIEVEDRDNVPCEDSCNRRSQDNSKPNAALLHDLEPCDITLYENEAKSEDVGSYIGTSAVTSADSSRAENANAVAQAVNWSYSPASNKSAAWMISHLDSDSDEQVGAEEEETTSRLGTAAVVGTRDAALAVRISALLALETQVRQQVSKNEDEERSAMYSAGVHSIAAAYALQASQTTANAVMMLHLYSQVLQPIVLSGKELVSRHAIAVEELYGHFSVLVAHHLFTALALRDRERAERMTLLQEELTGWEAMKALREVLFNECAQRAGIRLDAQLFLVNEHAGLLVYEEELQRIDLTRTELEQWISIFMENAASMVESQSPLMHLPQEGDAIVLIGEDATTLLPVSPVAEMSLAKACEEEAAHDVLTHSNSGDGSQADADELFQVSPKETLRTLEKEFEEGRTVFQKDSGAQPGACIEVSLKENEEGQTIPSPRELPSLLTMSHKSSQGVSAPPKTAFSSSQPACDSDLACVVPVQTTLSTGSATCAAPPLSQEKQPRVLGFVTGHYPVAGGEGRSDDDVDVAPSLDLVMRKKEKRRSSNPKVEHFHTFPSRKHKAHRDSSNDCSPDDDDDNGGGGGAPSEVAQRPQWLTTHDNKRCVEELDKSKDHAYHRRVSSRSNSDNGSSGNGNGVSCPSHHDRRQSFNGSTSNSSKSRSKREALVALEEGDFSTSDITGLQPERPIKRKSQATVERLHAICTAQLRKQQRQLLRRGHVDSSQDTNMNTTTQFDEEGSAAHLMMGGVSCSSYFDDEEGMLANAANRGCLHSGSSWCSPTPRSVADDRSSTAPSSWLHQGNGQYHHEALSPRSTTPSASGRRRHVQIKRRITATTISSESGEDAMDGGGGGDRNTGELGSSSSGGIVGWVRITTDKRQIVSPGGGGTLASPHVERSVRGGENAAAAAAILYEGGGMGSGGGGHHLPISEEVSDYVVVGEPGIQHFMEFASTAKEELGSPERVDSLDYLVDMRNFVPVAEYNTILSNQQASEAVPIQQSSGSTRSPVMPLSPTADAPQAYGSNSARHGGHSSSVSQCDSTRKKDRNEHFEPFSSGEAHQRPRPLTPQFVRDAATRHNCQLNASNGADSAAVAAQAQRRVRLQPSLQSEDAMTSSSFSADDNTDLSGAQGHG